MRRNVSGEIIEGELFTRPGSYVVDGGNGVTMSGREGDSVKLRDTKILIVEDEPIVSYDIQSILEGMGVMTTAIARSASEAVQAIEQDAPHLILLDLSLSGHFEGVELARAVQRRWHIPVLFISGHLGNGAVSGIEDVETAGFIAKPFYAVNLREAVASAVQSLPH